MPAKSKPYDRFGSYILFKKIEADALSELWRAARIENGAIGPFVALRRLTGGNREALVANATTTRMIAPVLSGTSLVKHQVVDVIDGIPFVAHDYAGGRSLRYIIDRARGGQGTNPNPIPIDQAIVIAEKIALSLETLSNMKVQGNRLTHGGLVPQFVWIGDDGEIRIAGQQLGAGMLASLKDARVGAELARYFAPEYRASGVSTRASEVYSAGALLFLVVTGQEPPDAHATDFSTKLRAAQTMAGEPMPDDIRAILDKTLTLEPSARYGSMADVKQALTALMHGGKYSATTFNLAFYLSSLLKKEYEAEVVELETESHVDVQAHLAPAPPVAAPPPVAVSPSFGSVQTKPASRAGLYIGAATAALFIGGGVAWMTMSPKAQPAKAVAAAATIPQVAKPMVVSQPILASPSGASTSTTPALPDEAARKKAFEDAVAQKLQEEMMKLQSDYNQQLASRTKPAASAASAPQQQVVAAPKPQQVAEERTPTAAQLDQQRRDSRPEPAAVIPVPTQSAAPVLPPQVANAAPAVAVSVREGELVDVRELDEVPRATRSARPVYPPLAAKQRVEGVVIVSALVSEHGEVLDVKVLRGVGRLGIDEAAVRAMRDAHFTPGTKDGKHVKTWMPQTIVFKL
jgi:TonB family protein